MKDIDGNTLEIGDRILVMGSQLRHAVIINILPDKAVYSKFMINSKYILQVTKLTEQQIYKID